jgi:hypothetical protein
MLAYHKSFLCNYHVNSSAFLLKKPAERPDDLIAITSKTDPADAPPGEETGRADNAPYLDSTRRQIAARRMLFGRRLCAMAQAGIISPLYQPRTGARTG